MTWHSILSAFQSLSVPCCEADLAEPEYGIFSFRGDAGFGLPLVNALLSENFFDISTAEPAPQPAEPLS